MNMLLNEISKEAVVRPLSRKEVLGMLFRLTVFGAAAYFGIKWMVDTIDPTRRQKVENKKRAAQLMKQIGVEGIKLSEHELMIATHLVDPRTLKGVTWRDVAGLDEVITELQETVILPFQKRHLFRESKLFQPPKGVLLYGPPGCGKTLIAKAIANVTGCHFINMQASALTDKWYGESQKLTAAVFSLAAKIEPCIVFIDEIDSFLRNRSCNDHEATAMMKAQFMSLWDGLSTDTDCQVIVMGATNRPQDVDPAILRRMPSTFHVSLPRQRQRYEILKLILSSECLNSDVRLKEIAEKTAGYSGSDLRELCREAALHRLRDFVRKEQMQCIERQLQADDYKESSTDEGLRAITQTDLYLALEKLKESKAGTNALILQDTPVD
ncbi:outer mitochondrial transmembrane helix translocase-like [Stegostoma tigrinum]|uniref:outer mitochondrial transmembrane helix translocase-like n=1 Tax=Stegostoma tigrinum TaxID=3053191 RepID=UPI00202B6679|nr:outer mitochondrial transmembrane helix translocase-like [Stegostoma tigrinum]XP_048379120.1 outer mitochondrial transmembrane helix translocase-like [Stegostoma tigrinum]XP_048379121.1 outer mitochondrial transmembrane helix translocase-like [Stegostoma tigrinum]XP_048379122.1 outer mitochondrial transmembrane helix translocase-like [Stegostoma tigrinum]